MAGEFDLPILLFQQPEFVYDPQQRQVRMLGLDKPLFTLPRGRRFAKTSRGRIISSTANQYFAVLDQYSQLVSSAGDLRNRLYDLLGVMEPGGLLILYTDDSHKISAETVKANAEAIFGTPLRRFSVVYQENESGPLVRGLVEVYCRR